MKPLRMCAFCGSFYKVYYHKGMLPLCKYHFFEMKVFGRIDETLIKSPAKLYTTQNFDDHFELHFVTGEIVLIDNEDKPLIDGSRWCINGNGYFSAFQGKSFGEFHRLIRGQPGLVVDHINRNKLDNRRENLRSCTVSNNAKNRSIQSNNTTGYTGIIKTKRGKYHARIQVDGKTINLGHHFSLEEAVRIRRHAEKKYYGEFAPENNKE